MRKRRATLKCWLFCFNFTVFLLPLATGDKAILLERPKPGVTGPRSWYWSASNTVGIGWVGPSGSLTSYSVCDVGLKPSNWLRSDGFNDNNLKKLDIAITYTMIRCSSFDDADTRLICKEHFDIYAYQTTANATGSSLELKNGKYSKIGSVVLPNISHANSSSKVTRTALLALFVDERTSKVFFAIHDQGSCSILLSFVVSYYVCPEETLPDRLVLLPETVAPTNESEVVRFSGKCANNSEPTSQEFYAICNSTGEWNTPADSRGQCLCKAGWEKFATKCRVCSPGYYKDRLGNVKCTPCPGNSVAKTNRISCKCSRGFYRAPWEGITHNCTLSGPSAPVKFRGRAVSARDVLLSWDTPLKPNGIIRYYYIRIYISQTGQQVNNLVKKSSSVQQANGWSHLISNLKPFRNYTFTVQAVTIAPGEIANCTERTREGVPSGPRDVTAVLSNGDIIVTWKDPEEYNGILLTYSVFYEGKRAYNSSFEDNGESVLSATDRRVVISRNKLKPGTSYTVYVKAATKEGMGERSNTVVLQTPSEGGSSEKWITIFAAVGALLLVMIVMIIVFCYCRFFLNKSKRPRTEDFRVSDPLRESFEDNVFPLVEMETVTEERRESVEDNVVAVAIEMETVGEEQDVPFYMDIDEVASFELERDKLKFQKLLGSGNFGEVFTAVLEREIVAVKSLQETATPKDRQDMLSELNVMKKLESHPHVVKLIGCCSCDGPLLIVLEYLPYGDLLGYLRKSRGHKDYYNTGEKAPTSKLDATDLLSFAWMTADGMNYLAEMKVVHRDLAARNVLVGENKVCKISDFGLARDVNTEIYVRQSQARLPVKWMPPESLFLGESSTMSDVWSYGILLWEIFTIGDSPYPGIKANRVASLLQTGYRMPRPIHISEELFAIMSECWSEKPEDRPTFQWLNTAVKRLLKDKKIYVNLDAYKDEDYVNFDMFDAQK